MPQIKLFTNNEELEKEQAEINRAREQEIQALAVERDKKLAQLVKKNKRNRILAITIFSLLSIALLVFGTYNTFFKEEAKLDDNYMLNQAYTVVRSGFSTASAEGYLKQHAAEFFNEMNSNNSNNVSQVYLDPDSIYVTAISYINLREADVYFNANIHSIFKDTKDEENNVIPGQELVEEYNFVIPLYWNGIGFKNSDNLRIPVEIITTNDITNEISDVYLLNYEGNSSVSDTDLENIKVMLDNYFNIGYNNKGNVSQFFTDPNTAGLVNNLIDKEYISINELSVYTNKNQKGYNGMVIVKLHDTQGQFDYTTKIYIDISQDSSGQWKINKIF